MENERIINVIVNHLKDEYYEVEIKDMLADENLPDEKFKELFEKAKAIFEVENNQRISKKNKRKFIIYLSTALFTAVFFFFVLPPLVEADSMFYSIVGAIILCFSGLYAFAYYKTWELKYVEEHESPSVSFVIIPILLIPGVILTFIFSYRFSSVAESILKKNQVEVMGRLVSGSEQQYRGRRGAKITTANVVVRFLTKEGREVTVEEDVSSYLFDQLSLDQPVHLIYSSSNPENIQLLITPDQIKEFKNMDVGSLNAEDLIRLLDLSPDEITDDLNSNSFGWYFSEVDQGWENNTTQEAMVVDAYGLTYITTNLQYYRALEESGFERTELTEEGAFSNTKRLMLYNKGDITAIVELTSTGNNIQEMICVVRMGREG